jgi:potassium/hydrogen antiporter
MADGHLLLIAGGFMAAALVASLLAARIRVPGLILFLGLGMVVGADGTGWVEFGRARDDYELARTVGIVALSLILFEGGLTSGLREIRPVLREAVSLAILGTLVTAVVAGLAAAWLLDLSTLEGLLLGSILAATDGAAIFALLRNSTLERRLARTLEGESGLNDPVAVLLVLGFIAWIKEPGYGIWDMLWLFVRQLGIGAAVGMVVGWAAVQGMRRARLATAGLYPVTTLATVGLAYGAADSLHGSGFLAVYLAGLALGSATIPAKQTVTNFHQGMAWLAQLTMFVVLGLLVYPSQLDEVALEGTVLAFVVVLVARPLAALVATVPFRFGARERLVLGWAGLRGAVPVVLATFPVSSRLSCRARRSRTSPGGWA